MDLPYKTADDSITEATVQPSGALFIDRYKAQSRDSAENSDPISSVQFGVNPLSNIFRLYFEILTLSPILNFAVAFGSH